MTPFTLFEPFPKPRKVGIACSVALNLHELRYSIPFEFRESGLCLLVEYGLPELSKLGIKNGMQNAPSGWQEPKTVASSQKNSKPNMASPKLRYR